MSSLSEAVGWIFGKPTVFFFFTDSDNVVLLDKECFCGDNTQKEYLFGKNSGPLAAFMEANFRATRFFFLLQQHISHVSVVGFRAALRVGLGSRDAARHCPIWQHLGMSRRQPNIAKDTVRFLSYLRTFAEIA